jgi:hypothetical protein
MSHFIQAWAQAFADNQQTFLKAMFPVSPSGPFDAGSRHVLEGPQYATLWDMDRKVLELQRLAAERDKAAASYQAILQRGWNRAWARFWESISTDGERPSTLRELTERWLATTNDTLIEVYRSSEFVEAQRRLLRQTSDHRLQERKIAEAWSEATHIPTRSEVDELQRTVIDMRRQLRTLQRASMPEPVLRPPAPNSRATAPARRTTRV